MPWSSASYSFHYCRRSRIDRNYLHKHLKELFFITTDIIGALLGRNVAHPGRSSIGKDSDPKIQRMDKATCKRDCSHEIKRCLLLGRKAMTHLDSILKSRDITLLTKVRHSQSYGFSSSHIWMWELDYKEIWVLKNWCFWTVVLEKVLESPLDSKEIKPVHPKGNLSWIFIERTDAEAPILWPPDVKSQLIGKDPDAGKDWGQEEKGTTEDEMVGWHHWLNGHEFEQAPGVGEGQGGLVCCSPWGHKELDTTEPLNNHYNQDT